MSEDTNNPVNAEDTNNLANTEAAPANIPADMVQDDTPTRMDRLESRVDAIETKIKEMQRGRGNA